MRALANFHPDAFGDTLISLSAAFGLGGLIGFERQFRQRTAGLRTNVLVSVGAAAFVDLAGSVSGPDGVTRVIAYVVSGIGFLGAGVIMKEGAHVRGLNTAATLWCSAAVGACSGGGYVAQAAALTAFVLAGNTLLRPLVDAINRLPISGRETEALYRVHLVCHPSDVPECRDLLFENLEAADYPIQSIEILSETEEQVELAAVLTPNTADPTILDAVTAVLEQTDIVLSATWTVSTTN